MFDLVRDGWRRKWLILGVSFLAACVAAGLSLLLPNWYTADVLLAPAEERTSVGIAGPLGSLANLAGISVGGGDSAEATAVLKSRDLARTYIEREGLLILFFEKIWDPELKKWKPSDPENHPDLREAVRYWDQKVRKVTEDRKTKLVRLTITWKDPVLAAKWANEFADLLNDRIRQRALADALNSVDYLREELTRTNEVVLKQSISRLIESEMQKITMARGNPEFAFKVIDRAEVPKRKSSPQRVLIVLAAAFLGGAATCGFVLWGALQRRRADASAAST